MEQPHRAPALQAESAQLQRPVTLPLHYRYITVTFTVAGRERSAASARYITVTLPLHLPLQAESAQLQRRFYATRLSAGTRLLLLLLRLRFNLDAEDDALLVSLLKVPSW